MISLQEYIEESLLDNIDELETSFDKNIDKQRSIGMGHEIDVACCLGRFSQFKSLFDIKKLKQIHKEYAVWESNDFNIRKYLNGKQLITSKDTVDVVKMFADIVLSINKDNLNDDFYHTKDIPELFDILRPTMMDDSKIEVNSALHSAYNKKYRIKIRQKIGTGIATSVSFYIIEK